MAEDTVAHLRLCKNCNLHKPASEFHKDCIRKDRPPERKVVCKNCCNAKRRAEWAAAGPVGERMRREKKAYYEKQYADPERRKLYQAKKRERAKKRRAIPEVRQAIKKKRVTDGERIRANERKSHLKCHYGLEYGEFLTKLKEQQFGCAICRKPLTVHEKKLGPNTACVDHCHATNATRGILCTKCNSGIGHFDDDPQRLRAAIQYLLNHGKQIGEARPD